MLNVYFCHTFLLLCRGQFKNVKVHLNILYELTNCFVLQKIDGWDLGGKIGGGGNIAPLTGGIPVTVGGELSGGYNKKKEHGDTNVSERTKDVIKYLKPFL